MSNDDDDDDPPEWSCKREEVTYNQAIRVLDTQIDFLNSIDDKAIDTIRIAAIVVGAFVALAKVQGLGLFEPITATIGVSVLLFSLLAGIITYQESGRLRIGPKRAYVQRLAENDFQDTSWDEDFFERSGVWIEKNHEEIEWNSKLLTLTQLCFFAGLFFLTLSVAL